MRSSVKVARISFWASSVGIRPAAGPGVDSGKLDVALLLEVDLPVPDGGHLGAGVAGDHAGTTDVAWEAGAFSALAMSRRDWQS